MITFIVFSLSFLWIIFWSKKWYHYTEQKYFNTIFKIYKKRTPRGIREGFILLSEIFWNSHRKDKNYSFLINMLRIGFIILFISLFYLVS